MSFIHWVYSLLGFTPIRYARRSTKPVEINITANFFCWIIKETKLITGEDLKTKSHF